MKSKKVFLILMVFICIVSVGLIFKNIKTTLQTDRTTHEMVGTSKSEVKEIINKKKNSLNKDTSNVLVDSTTYKDIANNTYVYDENDNVSLFIANHNKFEHEDYVDRENGDYSIKQKLESKEVRAIADRYYKEITSETNNSYYEQNYIESTGVYTVLYYYLINGYKTSDLLFIQINNNKELVGFGHPNQGLFKDITVPKVSSKKVEQYIKKELASRNEDYKSYDVNSDYMYDIVDGKIIIRVEYVITLDEDVSSGYSIDIPIGAVK